MIVISDTGPIIGLSKIDKIFLLKKIAKEILIPPMVQKELFGKTGPESEIIDKVFRRVIFGKTFASFAP